MKDLLALIHRFTCVLCRIFGATRGAFLAAEENEEVKPALTSELNTFSSIQFPVLLV